MPAAPPATLAGKTTTLAPNRLGTFAVACFTLAATTPITVTGAVFPTGLAITGLIGIPLAFTVVGIVLAVWAPGYVAMGRYIANAGALYTYVARGLGRPAGVAAAWLALASYNALQVGLYGAVGVAIEPLLVRWLHWDLSWWAIALVVWAAVAVLGLLHVEVNGRVLAVLLIAEIAIITLYAIADLRHPAGGHLTFDALAPSNLAGHGIGAALALGMLAFVGVEGAVGYSEECRNPKRTVPLATFTAIAVTIVVYTLSTWSQTVAVGPDHIIETAQAEGPAMYFTLAAANLGAWAADTGRVLFVTSLIAALLSFHNAVARYTFALGREAVLPRRLAQTSTQSNAPVLGSLAQSTIGLVVICVYAMAGWDPLIHLFFLLGTCGGLGVLVLITMTSIAVIVYFAQHPEPKAAEPAWRRLAAPTVASIALLSVSYLALTRIDTLLGVAPSSPLPWAIPTTIAVLAAAGVGWGLYLRTVHPRIYATIGTGPHSSPPTVGPAPTAPTAPTEPGRPAGDSDGRAGQVHR
jgi:amino acid transporter